MDIATLVVVGLVIITALTFDFTNGFHDTANAMATSIATGALKPKTAVIAAGTGRVTHHTPIQSTVPSARRILRSSPA